MREDVSIFDIQEYVRKMKKKKLLEMMNDSDQTKSETENNLGEQIFIKADTDKQEEVENINNKPAEAVDDMEESDLDFDVDEMIAKINKKIEELEKLESIEKEKNKRE